MSVQQCEEHGNEQLPCEDCEKETREARIERQQIEEVFCLGGGELDDKPWEPFAPWDTRQQYHDGTEMDVAKEYEWMVKHPYDQVSERVTFRYTFDDVPEWCADEYKDLFDAGVHYRTVLRDCLFGLPPKTLVDGGRVWNRVSVLGPSSGEAACPWQQIEGEDSDGFNGEGPDAECELCEHNRSDGHGAIYVGDGWCEVVYKCIDPKCETCGEFIYCGKTGARFCDADCEAAND